VNEIMDDASQYDMREAMGLSCFSLEFLTRFNPFMLPTHRLNRETGLYDRYDWLKNLPPYVLEAELDIPPPLGPNFEGE